MAMIYTTLTNFSEQLRIAVSKVEDLCKQPRDVGDHTVTYGYGYTFIRKNDQGYWARYGNLDSDLAAIGIILTPAQKDALNAIAESLTNGQGATQTHAQLITDFAASLGRPDLTTTDAQALFDAEWVHQKAEMKTKFESLLGTAAGDTAFYNLENTREMVAVASMFYNSPGLLGGGLARALRDGMRAEAWFEIRYGWADNDPTFNDGWAKRHYYEAEIFGLYNDSANVGLDEAKDVYRMLQLHRGRVTDYESKYSAQIANANNDYHLTGSATVDTLAQALDLAKTTLINDLNTNSGTHINAADFLSTDIYIDPGRTDNTQLFDPNRSATLIGSDRNDILLGEAGNDTLSGGAGDDVLVGGAGSDTLQGGTGNDTYLGDTGDKAYDIDGKGKVNFDGTLLTGGSEGQQPGIYEGNGFKYYLAGDGKTVRVVGPDGSMTISSGTGDFRVTEVWEQLYFNGIPSGGPTYIETLGDPAKVPLGIELFDKKIQKRFLWPSGGGGGGWGSFFGFCPIVLDLNGDGIQTTALSQSSPLFDHAGDGFAEATGWVTPEDGFLALDLNGNGLIDSGREIFGNNTLLQNGEIAKHGFEALAELDLNKDGQIDGQDAIFDQLRIWQDSDSDAVTDAGELKSLEDAGVKSISLNVRFEEELNNGNTIFVQGQYTRTDGSIGAASDVDFVTAPHRGQEIAPNNDPELEILPDLAGSGGVPSLKVAMQAADDSLLKDLVEQFMAEQNDTKRLTLADDILMAWTGAGRTGNRQVAVAAWFAGEEAGQDWQLRFAQLRERIYAELTLATDFKEWYAQLDVKLQGDGLEVDTSKWTEMAATARAENPADFASKCGRFVRALAGLNGWEGRMLATSVVRSIDSFDNILANALYEKQRFFTQRWEIGGDNPDGSLIENSISDELITLDVGANTVRFDRFSGHDTLIDWSGALDALTMGEDIQESDVELTAAGPGITLNLRESDASITLQSQVFGEHLKIVFDDGSEWTWDDIAWRADISSNTAIENVQYGTAAGDELIANGQGGVIFAGAGDDLLTGSAFDDILVGDAGNDTLQGGAGNDILDGGLNSGDTIHNFQRDK